MDVVTGLVICVAIVTVGCLIDRCIKVWASRHVTSVTNNYTMIKGEDK